MDRIFDKGILNRLWCLVLLGLLCSGCKDYLEAKPDQRLRTVETVADMRALLDYYQRMNWNDVSTLNACSDDYFVSDAVFNARTEYDRNLYLWAGANVFAPGNNAWADAYESINIANVVLDGVALQRGKLNDLELDVVEAEARFFRGRSFLSVLGVWTPAYEAGTAANVLGIPLRLNANFNEASVRANQQESYLQVLADLQRAALVLPAKAVSPLRASKSAAYGLLSRVHLSMGDYVKAGAYADSCLRIQSTLLDYNTLNAAAGFPIAHLNVEVVFDSRSAAAGTFTQARALVNPALFALYETNDLRRTVFFGNSGSDRIFKGQYSGNTGMFNGVAVDELLLTRAECYARLNRGAEALADLNRLLRARYRTGTFSDLVLTGSALLARIKLERRKELAYRSIRWTDVKRWNREGDGIVLSRTVGGQTYSLQPNSLLYAIALPQDVIALSGMVQNPR